MSEVKTEKKRLTYDFILDAMDEIAQAKWNTIDELGDLPARHNDAINVAIYEALLKYYARILTRIKLSRRATINVVTRLTDMSGQEKLRSNASHSWWGNKETPTFKILCDTIEKLNADNS